MGYNKTARIKRCIIPSFHFKIHKAREHIHYNCEEEGEKGEALTKPLSRMEVSKDRSITNNREGDI